MRTRESDLEICCYKAVDDRIHTAIQTAEGDGQVIDDNMMRHVGVEVHHHLQDKKTAKAFCSTKRNVNFIRKAWDT